MNEIDLFNLLAAGLTPIIAVITVYIAYRQYSISKRTIKLELYEKRYNVFRALKKLLLVIYSKGNIEQSDLFEFLNGTDESPFLYDSDINEYLKEIFEKAIELQDYNEQLDGNELQIGDERSTVSLKTKELKLWFHKQNNISINKFKTYLDFRKI